MIYAIYFSCILSYFQMLLWPLLPLRRMTVPLARSLARDWDGVHRLATSALLAHDREIFAKKIIGVNKSYFISLKDPDSGGRYFKLTEQFKGRKSTMFVPLSGAETFLEHVASAGKGETTVELEKQVYTFEKVGSNEGEGFSIKVRKIKEDGGSSLIFLVDKSLPTIVDLMKNSEGSSSHSQPHSQSPSQPRGDKEIFSKTLRRVSKTYFFDVKVPKAGENYLQLTVTYKGTGRARMFIPTSQILTFSDNLISTDNEVGGSRVVELSGEKFKFEKVVAEEGEGSCVRITKERDDGKTSKVVIFSPDINEVVINLLEIARDHSTSTT